MVKIEYDKFGGLEELEFKFFKELNIDLLKPVEEEIGSKINSLFSNYKTFNLLIALKLIDNKVICSDGDEFYLFDNILNLKDGEIICLKRYDNEIFKIEKDILNEKFLDECRNKLGDYKELDENIKIKNNFLKKEDIEKEIERVIKETEYEKEDIEKEIERVIKETEYEKEERLKEKKEEEEKEKEGYEEKKKYEKESIFNSNKKSVKVNKNEIEIGTVKFVLTKNANKIFDYDTLSSYYFSSENIKETLIKKEVGFAFYINTKKIYELKYEKNKKEEIIKSLEEKQYYSKAKINGVRVRRNKILFILDKIDEKTTTKEIKLWNRFLAIQLDLLNIKKIRIKDIPVDINFSVADKNKFLVELFGKKEKLDWEILRNTLCYGRSINHYLSLEKFIKFSEMVGFTKQDVYDKLKELSKKNEN